MKKTELEQAFLENANEATLNIREIYHIFGGYGDESSPEEGTLLGDVYAYVAEMISIYLVPITGKELHCDELYDMTTDLMHVNKEDIGSFVKKYCDSSV